MGKAHVRLVPDYATIANLSSFVTITLVWLIKDHKVGPGLMLNQIKIGHPEVYLYCYQLNVLQVTDYNEPVK